MADDDADAANISNRSADEFVRARIPDPSAAPQPSRDLTGLLGDSDRAGSRRLYFNTRLDYYAEFREEDVVAVQSVPSDQPPFLGLDATRVSLKHDARIDYVHSQVGVTDPFDLDVRGVQRDPRSLAPAETWEAECPGPSAFDPCQTDFACGTVNDCPTGWGTVCKPATCLCPSIQDDCETRFDATCRTCRTCGQATCRTCNQATCQTCNQATCVTCGQATCQTCNQATCVTCGQATCGTCNQATCQTCAGQNTCQTCDCTDFQCGPTFAQTHCFTCRSGCQQP
jgi:hypothetical protein